MATIATRYQADAGRVLDMAVKVAQLCLEHLPEDLDVSRESRTSRLAQMSLVFVEGVSRTAKERQMMPLIDAFSMYRLSGCPRE